MRVFLTYPAGLADFAQAVGQRLEADGFALIASPSERDEAKTWTQQVLETLDGADGVVAFVSADPKSVQLLDPS